MDRSWLRSGAVGLLASVLLPPLGLLLIWTRPGIRLAVRVLASVALAVLGVAYLYLFFGLRMEVDGSGVRPILSFHQPERHYAAIEEDRAAPRIVPAAAPLSPAADRELAAPAAEAAWPAFRGRGQLGVYESPIQTAWPAKGLPRLWKQPVGGGYSSFAVAGGKAFTIEQRRSQEVVAAYDLKTGRELWKNAWDGLFQESMGGDGPRTTPTWDQGRLYALGALGEFRCLDAETGKLLWTTNILEENGAENLTWAMSASPLIVQDKVIVLPGGQGRSVVAYDKKTGKTVWAVLTDKQAYTTPIEVTLAGQRQILVVSATRAMGLTPDKGELLWSYPWRTEYDVNSAQPIVTGPDRFFISAGYGHGAALVRIVRKGAGFSAETVWQNTRMKNKFASSVLYQGHIYGLDEAILASINAETGALNWKGGRYGYGQLVLAGGYLIVLSEAGELVLVKATPERHTELARFPAIEGKTWNHPAVAGGLLLVRNTEEMACFRIAP